MQQFEINVKPRTDVGKGASRRLRRSGKVPGIIYGAKKDALPIRLAHNELICQLENEAFYSRILTVNLGKKAEKVVLKDLQRHPCKASILHIDFQRIDENKKLTMRIPLHFTNASKCVGVKAGGVVNHIMTEIEISCLPKKLPEYIDVDLLELELGETTRLGDLKMADGVEISALVHGGDPSQSVVSVNIPRVEEEREDEGEGAEEGAETAVLSDTPTDDKE